MDNHIIWRVMKIDNWSQGDEKTDLVLEISKVVTQGREHLSCSLGVSYVGNFVRASSHSHIIDLSWSIDLTKFEETVVEEVCLIGVWVVFCVGSAVKAPSIVSKPHIESCISKLEGN